MFKGLFVALITPFDSKSKLDTNRLKQLVQFHITAKTDGLVPCGTTGENPTFTEEEHVKVMETVINEAKGKLKIIAGTGSNNTDKAIRLTKKAEELGADAALVITPYYNKPTQEGLFLHFKKVAEHSSIPIILYNVPSRTGVNLLPETVRRLAEINAIVGIKEASGSLPQVMEMIRIKDMRPDFSILSGDDLLTLPIIAVGGDGVISVSGNLFPKTVRKMVSLCLENNFVEARKIHYNLLNFTKALFIETNPAPIKKAMEIAGQSAGGVRLPLSQVSEQTEELLKKELELL